MTTGYPREQELMNRSSWTGAAGQEHGDGMDVGETRPRCRRDIEVGGREQERMDGLVAGVIISIIILKIIQQK